MFFLLLSVRILYVWQVLDRNKSNELVFRVSSERSLSCHWYAREKYLFEVSAINDGKK